MTKLNLLAISFFDVKAFALQFLLTSKIGKHLPNQLVLIAEIYGFNSMTFSKAVDVNNDQFHLKPEQIEAIASYTKDIRILQSMASMYENVAIYQYPNYEIIGDCSFLANIGEVSNKVGELFNGLSESLKDHIITEVEMAMIEKHAMELISAVATLKNLARKKSENDLKHEDH